MKNAPFVSIPFPFVSYSFPSLQRRVRFSFPARFPLVALRFRFHVYRWETRNEACFPKTAKAGE
jgi:hypothetical protein